MYFFSFLGNLYQSGSAHCVSRLHHSHRVHRNDANLSGSGNSEELKFSRKFSLKDDLREKERKFPRNFLSRWSKREANKERGNFQEISFEVQQKMFDDVWWRHHSVRRSPYFPFLGSSPSIWGNSRYDRKGTSRFARKTVRTVKNIRKFPWNNKKSKKFLERFFLFFFFLALWSLIRNRLLRLR